eukprot:3497094-Pleurochrysis_carterae.AAC.1
MYLSLSAFAYAVTMPSSGECIKSNTPSSVRSELHGQRWLEHRQHREEVARLAAADRLEASEGARLAIDANTR